ncbi:MAG: polysaccharide deacetylase family protein [Calothrix sp. C42_A2020_038]|nr:polysaccharide deacetylase family protein [Calothrix sp. C42_A2020_038]
MTLISRAQFWKRRLFNVICWGSCVWGLCPVMVYAAETSQNVQLLENNTLLGKIITLSSNTVVQISSWVAQPKHPLQSAVEQYAPYVYAYFNSVGKPDIHPHARLAKVPILMYHDILPQKLVFFDVTPAELEQHFQQIQASGATPISAELLEIHLRTGIPLPKKPILLTFDDGYGGHYHYVYPLLKKYNYPAVFSIYVKGVGDNAGRSHVSWEELREMSSNPLVTIASHTVSHPLDLRLMSDEQLQTEIAESKRILESQLNIPIRYFTYPVGKFDQRVAKHVYASGYSLAFTMRVDDSILKFAGDSENLLAVERIGQSKLDYAITQALGGRN